MAEIDELFEEQAEEKNETGKMTREEWQIKREEARTEAFNKLEEATESLSDPKALETYLCVQSRLDRYSVSNALLIAAQMPEATRLADFSYWQSHGASINKGEHGITILEPREYTRGEGTAGVSYEPKKVFDISQTTSEAKSFKRKPVDEKKLVKALTKTSPVKLVIDNDLPENVNARFSPEAGNISVRQGLTGDEIFKALTQEIEKARTASADRQCGSFEAVAVSFILCQRYDVPPPSLPEENPFEGKEPKDVRRMLKDIRDEANNMSAVMDKALESKNRDAR